ncbi:MAG: peptide-methionine (S)-S-oxide reductase MsrA [Bdellovibrionales bacterium]|nr:peptide-methionine (S)-S-oxide reductase MsrA [Bdellovibrionales bacterium]
MKSIKQILFLLIILLSSCTHAENTKNLPNINEKVATFAGGCFWCLQPSFDELDGVTKTFVGYAGGKTPNPTYQDVGTGKSGYIESIEIYYDSTKINFEKLLEVYWQNIDPTDAGGQFADRGPQYQPVIFFHDEEQKQKAQSAKEALSASNKFSKPIVVEIRQYTNFYPAEEYHQEYYKKNAIRYKLYKKGSGREDFIQKHWK